MCIKRDGSMCPLLSSEEQVAQHNFEERKGPFPEALALRLDREGIMPREEHLQESLARRTEHAKAMLRGARDQPPFTPNMDCEEVERDFMTGKRHDLPVDPWLPADVWHNLSLRFNDSRQLHFIRKLTGIRRTRDGAKLIEYPEFILWFGAYATRVGSNHIDLRYAVDRLVSDPQTLNLFAAKAGNLALRLVLDQIFRRFLNDGLIKRMPELLQKFEEVLPSSYLTSISRLKDKEVALRAMPLGHRKQQRAYRKARTALRQEISVLAIKLQDEQHLTTEVLHKLAILILENKPVASPEDEPLSIAA